MICGIEGRIKFNDVISNPLSRVSPVLQIIFERVNPTPPPSIKSRDMKELCVIVTLSEPSDSRFEL